MNQTRKPRGVCATKQGLQKLQQAKAAKRGDNNRPWTYERIAHEAKVDEKTVKRFFRGDRVDKDSAWVIVEALDLPITEVVDPDELNPPPQPIEPGQTSIDWQSPGGISQNVSGGQVYGGIQAAQGDNNQQTMETYTAAPTEKRK